MDAPKEYWGNRATVQARRRGMKVVHHLKKVISKWDDQGDNNLRIPHRYLEGLPDFLGQLIKLQIAAEEDANDDLLVYSPLWDGSVDLGVDVLPSARVALPIIAEEEISAMGLDEAELSAPRSPKEGCSSLFNLRMSYRNRSRRELEDVEPKFDLNPTSSAVSAAPAGQTQEGLLLLLMLLLGSPPADAHADQAQVDARNVPEEAPDHNMGPDNVVAAPRRRVRRIYPFGNNTYNLRRNQPRR